MTTGTVSNKPKHQTEDRLWFEQHPTRTHRLRAAFDAEDLGFELVDRAAVPEGYAVQVLVCQIKPGCRVRVPWGCLPAGYDGDSLSDELVHAMFDFAFSHPGKVPGPDDIAEIERRAQLLESVGGGAQ